MTIARRSVSSRSARQRSNGPSKVQTSGAGSARAARLAATRPRHDAAVVRRRASALIGAARTVRAAAAMRRSPAGDLQRDLGRGVRAVVAGAVDRPLCAQPVALGQHGDRLGPRPVARAVGALGGDVPLVRTQRAAGAALRFGRRRRAGAAQARQLVEREAVAREARRAGLAGEPVDLAAARARRTPARRRCARCRLRWLYDRPLRITSAASRRQAVRRAGAGAPARRRRVRPRRRGAPATPRTASTRCGRAHLGLAVGRGRERRHHAGDAERAGARVALAPAFGDDVDDRAAACTSPSRRR